MRVLRLCQLAVALALLVPVLDRPLSLALEAKLEAAPELDSACLSRIAIAAQGSSPVLTAQLLNNITASVLACAGIGGGATAIRPLRLVLPREANETMAQVIPLVRSVVGWDLEPTYVGVTEVGPTVLSQTTTLGKAYFDTWGGDSSYTLEYAQAGLLEPLDSYVLNDPKLDWPDFLGVLRSGTALFNGTVVGLPLTSVISSLLFRRDVLASAGLQPPNTWRELLQVARVLNGTDMNQDGVGDFAVCLDINPGKAGDPSSVLGQVLASITQTQGSGHGWLFDPENMNAFVDSEAFSETLSIIQQLTPYNVELGAIDDAQTNNPFVQGRCALQIKNILPFKASQLRGKLAGRIGTLPIPGSDIVLDRSTGRLVPCTTSLCPHATWISGVGVNRASYAGRAGGVAMINANSLGVFQSAAYQFQALTTSYQFSMSRVMALGVFGPVRYKHLCVTRSCLAGWERLGYNGTDVAMYLNTTRWIADHPNTALDLRIEHGNEYRDQLINAMNLLFKGGSIQSIRQATAAAFATITARTPLQQLGDGYVAGLNLRRKFVMPTPPPPPPSRASTATPPADESGGLAKGAQIGIIVGACSAFVLLLAVAALLVVARAKSRRRWGLFGQHLAPGAGSATTLVVTDVEGSTTLWELLPVDVMNAVMDLHHKLVRKLLDQHGGYESDTEGDSFIVAFASPWGALAFAEDLQRSLMKLPWPTELLQSNVVARAMWAQKGKVDMAELWGKAGDALAGAGAAYHKDGREGGPGSRIGSFFLTKDDVQGVMSPRGSAVQGAVVGTPRGSLITARSGGFPSVPDMQGHNLLEHMRVKVPQAAHPLPATLARPEVPSHAGIGIGSLQSMPSASQGALEPREESAASVGTPPASDAMVQFMTNPLATRNPSRFNLSENGGLALGPETVLSLLRKAWLECPTPEPQDQQSPPPGRILVHRGLRVRVGVHSGLPEQDVVVDQDTRRTKYRGTTLSTAKAMCDCGHGGTVLLSEACFAALATAPRKEGRDAWVGSIVHLGHFAFEAALGGASHPAAVFAAVSTDPQSQARVPLLLGQPLRAVTQEQLGALQAPAGVAAVAFVNVIGAAVLSAWDADVAAAAFSLLHTHARQLLAGSDSAGPLVTSGYPVKLAEGLCVCSFSRPAAALAWGVRLVNELRLTDEWDHALLAHELCEEVVVDQHVLALAAATHQRASAPRASPFATTTTTATQQDTEAALAEGRQEDHVLFRGLRLKVGVDAGPLQATITPGTGRTDYRGRVMNRAARIAAKAQAGQVWASKVTWEMTLAEREQAISSDALLETQLLDARALGAFSLKGVSEQVELVHCMMKL